MKNQALFSSKEKSKKLKCRLLQFLFGALRVKYAIVYQKLVKLPNFLTQNKDSYRLLIYVYFSIAHSLSFSTSHCPYMTEILLKKT